MYKSEIQDLVRYFLRRPFIILLAFYILFIWLWRLYGNSAVPRPSPGPEGRRGSITGIIATHPDPRKEGCVYMIQGETIQFFEEKKVTTSFNQKLLLYVVASTSPIGGPGDRLQFWGTLRRARASSIPGTFNYYSYLQNQGIDAIVYTASRSVENLGSSGQYRLLQAGWRCKRWLVTHYHRVLPAPEAAVLSGLTVGLRPRFDERIKTIFLKSGTMHILVASGSNVAFVFVFAYTLFHFLFRLPKPAALIFSLIPVFFYALIVGLDAPIRRATWMATTGVLTYLGKREDRAYHALMLSAFAILLTEPNTLFDIGFQMSFVTVFGLIHTFSQLNEPQDKSPRLLWGRRFLFSSLIAQVWLFPITANVFHRFYPMSIIANLFLLPLSALGFPIGLLLISCPFVPSFFGSIITSASYIFLHFFILLTTFFAEKIGVTWGVASWGTLTIIGFYTMGLSAPIWKKFKLSRWVFLLGSLTFLCGFLKDRTARQMVGPGRIFWLDVGRRVCPIFQTATGEVILVDPPYKGRSDEIERTLRPFLTEQGVGKIRAVVITRDDVATQFSPGDLQAEFSVKTFYYLNPSSAPASNLSIFVTTDFHAWVLSDNSPHRKESPLLVKFLGQNLILSRYLPIKVQREILNIHPAQLWIIQTRFSPSVRWDDNFKRRFIPTYCIDTGYGSDKQPVHNPWQKSHVIIPQKEGWGITDVRPVQFKK